MKSPDLSIITGMEYLVSAVILIPAAFFFYKMIFPSADPDMTFKPSLKNDADRVLTEAARNKEFRPHGKGVGVNKVIRELKAQHRLAEKRQRELMPFERWLYENHLFLLEQAYAQKRRRVRYMRLPSLGYPRIYTLCETIVKGNDGSVTRKTVDRAVDVFSRAGALTFGEVQSIREMLALALVEYCAVVARQSKKLFQSEKRARVDALHHRIDTDRISDDAYVYFLYDLIREEERAVLENLCADNGHPIGRRNESLLVRLAHLNGSVSSAVTSLRRLPELFTSRFTLSLSPVDRLLLAENAVGYEKSTTETRYHYCRCVSKTAKRRKTGELSVAAQAAAVSVERGKDVAFALLPPPKGRPAMRLYIGAQWLITLCLPIFLPLVLGGWGIVAYFLCLPIAFALVVTLTASLCRLLFPARYLPRLDLEGQENAHPTLIVVPNLIADQEEVEKAFGDLETLAYANPGERYRYALLLDLLPNKKGPSRPEDTAVLEAVENKFRTLSQRDRCLVVVRARRRNGDGVWCGWEKKRGALIELNELLLTGKCADDHLILGQIPSAELVITLDSDTAFNRADELVEIMAHPYNAEVNVVGLSMRSENASARATGFSRLFSGAKGLHAYSQTLSDPANDLFGRGNFTGKGIYRVKEFHALTGAAFRPDTLLSHDFIEGAVAGYRDSDLFGMDVFPADFSSFLTRKLRWLRGDLQLLPYLMPKIRNMAGDKVVNPLTPMDKHHIGSVTVFGLLPISSLLLTFLSLWTSPLLLIAAFALPIAAILASVRRSALKRNAEFAGETLRQLFLLAVLPAEACYNACAIGVTLFRLLRQKHLMEWKVSAHYKGRVSLLACLIAGALLIAAAAVFRLNAAFYAIGAIFVSAYAFDRLSARRLRRKTRRNEGLDALLKDEACRTWAYFAAQLTPENGYLPCDNYSPSADLWTRRTSPTDIGMAFIAVVSACKLKFISLEEGTRLVDRMLSQVEAAPKWRGHLYNWMDSDLLVDRRYVSAVDSGNLLACMHIAANFFPAHRARLLALIEATQMEALFDKERGLLFIGYDADSDTYDKHHYDLMGSESTTAYLEAIGWGKLKRRVWNDLSRRTVRYAGKLLFSWTGGIFEYLLNPIFYPYPEGGLLDKTAKNAVRSHIAYARKREMALWGISECQYTQTAADGSYGYRAFGVPGIALNGTDSDVVAPYACLMSVRWAPGEVERALRRLIDVGARGRYGFYEAVAGETVIQSYMAHHKGMALGAICNYLCDDALGALTAADGAGRAARLLLSEPAEFGRSARQRPRLCLNSRPDPVYTLYDGDAEPYVFLTDGNYSAVLDRHMNGYAYMDGLLTGGCGLTVELRAEGKAYDLQARTYSAWQAVYGAETAKTAVTCTVFVTPDGEYRLMRIQNRSDRALDIEVECRLRPFPDSHDTTFGVVTQQKNDYVTAYRHGQTLPLLLAMRVEGGDTQYAGSDDGRFGRRPYPALRALTRATVQPHDDAKLVIRLSAAYSPDRLQTALRAAAPAEGESYALGLLYAPLPVTARLGSRLLAGLGESVGQADLPAVILDARSESLERRLVELAKLYRCGVPFQTVIALPSDERFTQYAERAHRAVRRAGIDAFRAVVFERADRLPPPTVWETQGSINQCPKPFLRQPRPMALPPVQRFLEAKGGCFTPEAAFFIEPRIDTYENVFSDGETALVCGVYGVRQMRTRQAVLTEANEIPAVVTIVGERDTVWSIEPLSPADDACRVAFGVRSARYLRACNGIEATHTVSLARNGAALHRVTVVNRKKIGRKLDVLLAVRPVLGDRQRPYRYSYQEGTDFLRVTDTCSGRQVWLRGSLPHTARAFSQEAFIDGAVPIRAGELPDCGCRPALAYSVRLPLAAGEQRTVVFTVSTDGTDCAWAEKARPPAPCLTVETGDKALDLLLERLCYAGYGMPEDTSAERLAGCAALLYIDPDEVRARLLEAAALQSADGRLTDSPAGAAALLPHAVCDYIAFTGRTDVFDESVPFLVSSGGRLQQQKRGASLAEHCLIALLGCPLQEGLVAENGKRDVPASMLLITAVARFMSYVRDTETRLRLSALKKQVSDAVEAAWDGEWYLEGFEGDLPIGSADSPAHPIYLLPQALSVFCMPRKRARRAALSAFARLFDGKQGLLRYTLPTEGEAAPAGVDKNGGQYTPAAVLFLRALFSLGEIETAYRLIELLDPIANGADRPYVLPLYRCADDHFGYDHGQCGAYLYRCLVEDMLGIRFCGKRVSFEPKLPQAIENVTVRLPVWDVTVRIDNTGEGNAWAVSVDDIRYNTDGVTLSESLRGRSIKIVKTTV